jgi:hypothetical protein
VQAGEGCPDGSFVQLVRVDPVGNDRKSGRRLKRVIEEIDGTTRCNRALVTIGAGRYRVVERIDMPHYVDLMGEGERETRLIGDEEILWASDRGSTMSHLRLRVLEEHMDSYPIQGFVGTLRHVTFIGSFSTDYGDVVMRHVTAVEHGVDMYVDFGGYSADLRYVTLRGSHLSFSGGPHLVRDSKIIARDQGGGANSHESGIGTYSATIELTNVTIKVVGAETNIGMGLYADFDSHPVIDIRDSVIKASDHTISSRSDYTADATQTNYVTNTKLIGGPVLDQPASHTECTNVIDENNATYNGTCP